MGLLLGTNLLDIQDVLSLYCLWVASIFRIHSKVAVSFRLLPNYDYYLDAIFSCQQNSGKIKCFSFPKLHQTSHIAFILLLDISWTDNHGLGTLFAWLPQANFASLRLHAASYLSENISGKSREGDGSPKENWSMLPKKGNRMLTMEK